MSKRSRFHTSLKKAASAVPREKAGTNIPSAVVASIAGEGIGGSSLGGGSEWFGPGQPLRPVAPPDVAGRQFDYPVHYNITQRPRAYENLSFDQLRAVAENYDLLRLAIEKRKDEIEAYEWKIVAKEGKKVSQSTLDDVTEFWMSPNKEHAWATWLRAMLEDMLVVDAIALYPRATQGGGLYALELMDPGTLKRVIDDDGRTPMPPLPAFQQVLKGLPSVDYNRDELLYYVRNPRTNKIYGYSPVEQVIMTVNVAMRRQLHQLNYFTSGNVPELIAGVPPDWDIDMIAKFQLYWDSVIEGNPSMQRKMKFVPFDPSKIYDPKAEALKDLFDEWLARIICFAFSISPSALVKETNRGTAGNVQQNAAKSGLMPTLKFVKSIIDTNTWFRLKQRDVEFEWDMQEELDPLVQAQIYEIYDSSGLWTKDEIRDDMGLPPLTPEQEAKMNPPPPPPPLQLANPPNGQPPSAKPPSAAPPKPPGPTLPKPPGNGRTGDTARRAAKDLAPRSQKVAV